MKQILLVAAVLASSVQSHAGVADKFKCELSITENGGESIQQNFEFDLSRVPRSGSPSPAVRLTSAAGYQTIQLNNKSRVINASLSLTYSHGIKVDSGGHALEARQAGCFLLMANFCANPTTPPPDGGETVSCIATGIGCVQSNDPFDPSRGWTVVGLTPDGTPLFDEKSLVTLISPFTDSQGQVKGTAKANCAYQGTYW